MVLLAIPRPGARGVRQPRGPKKRELAEPCHSARYKPPRARSSYILARGWRAHPPCVKGGSTTTQRNAQTPATPQHSHRPLSPAPVLDSVLAEVRRRCHPAETGGEPTLLREGGCFVVQADSDAEFMA